LPAASHRPALDNLRTRRGVPANADEKFAEVRGKTAKRLFSKTIRPIACGFS
jgi:hypothetical protein